MITRISVENFKGIGDRVDVELRPLTLLFGPNSAGKSSILHALHYAREIFERQNINPDRTIAGGEFVDLGGFPAFVHNHDLGREVKISIRLDLREKSLPDYYAPQRGEGTFLTVPVGLRKIGTAELTVRVAWDPLCGKSYLREYSVNLDDEWMCAVQSVSRSGERRLRVNTRHSRLKTIDRCRTFRQFLDWRAADESSTSYYPLTENDSVVLGLLAIANESALLAVDFDGRVATITLSESGVLPAWHSQSLSLPFDFDCHAPTANWHGTVRPERVSSEDFLVAEDALGEFATNDSFDDEVTRRLTRQLDAALTQIVAGPCLRAYEALQKFRYVGPLREVPSRTYSPPRYPDPSRWACGLGAWDELHTGSPELVQSVSRWLGDRDRLDAGYQLQRKEYKEVDLNDPVVTDFLAGKQPDETFLNTRLQMTQLPTQAKLIICPLGRNVGLSPHDIGVGISQLIRVVVTALADREHLIVIEQPELHLHPRLQANLGDLFIEAAVGERKQTVILETHSEHLLLRIMRRIRETTTGQLPDDCTSVRADQVSVLYVEPEAGGTIAREMPLNELGELVKAWPGGFFEEGLREVF